MLFWILVILVVTVVTVIAGFMGRWHGAGVTNPDGSPTGWPRYGREVSTVFIFLAFAAGNYAIFEIWQLAIVGGLLSAGAFATGHGRVYEMKGANLQDPKQEQLEVLFGWLYRGDITKPGYSWYIMGLKGFFIGLAIPPIGLLLAFLWPSAYSWSWTTQNTSASAEWVTVGFAGFMVAVTVATRLILGA